MREIKDKHFYIFPPLCNKWLLTGTILLAIFGSFMIASAEMASSTGDSSIIVSAIIRQLVFVLIGITAMSILSHIKIVSLKEVLITKVGFFVILGALLITRAFNPVGGAYAWISFGGFSIQPSEFAKLYIIILFAKVLGKDYGPEQNKAYFKKLLLVAALYAGIIVLWQKDLGSAIVLVGIAFVLLMIANRKEFIYYQRRMLLVLLAIIAAGLFLLSPIGTSILENFDGYQVARFLSSANPFKYQYDSGYHLIMSLVSFATGGLFGLGYGRSIHKYMNFPNPDNDFILPVIVEELGLVGGFIPVIVLYGMVMIPLVKYSFKTSEVRQRIVFVGVFMYFFLHFCLNVGGVTGLIPLTGVPLLLLSSGGSSTLSCMMAVGVALSEISRYEKSKRV